MYARIARDVRMCTSMSAHHILFSQHGYGSCSAQDSHSMSCMGVPLPALWVAVPQTIP